MVAVDIFHGPAAMLDEAMRRRADLPDCPPKGFEQLRKHPPEALGHARIS
jgi:hypothetical protein